MEYLLSFTPNYHSGVIKHLIDDVNPDDFDVEKGGQVEIIGWLYQYYNTKPKNRAFKKKKYDESDIPAVTQLFTPDWIVKYMVENSLGRYWINILQAKGDSRTSQQIAESYGWNYFMPSASQSEEVQIQISANIDDLSKINIEDITFLDPAMGSGHILIYAFDLFMQLYESEGYSRRDATKEIIQKNIFGLDIDTRAFQLSYFALMMKARQYNRRFLTKNIRPNVYDIPESSNLSVDDFSSVLKSEEDTINLQNLLNLFKNGNEYGSLIHFKNDPNCQLLDSMAKENLDQQQLSFESIQLINKQHELREIISVAKILNDKFSVCVTNPPYMGSGKMDPVLSKYVKKEFINSKSDLFATFIERMGILTAKDGYYSMVTQHSWMFLSSFESLRKILQKNTLINMAHLGTRAFEEIGGEVVQSTAFVYRNQQVPNYVGTYERLVDFNSQQKKKDAYLKAVQDSSVNYLYRTNQANFSKIPGMPIAYWASKAMIRNFGYPNLYDQTISPSQNVTGNNKRFLRFFWEIDSNKINANDRWIFYAKGGGYRKWYGNLTTIVNWTPQARKIYQFGDGKHASQIINKEYWYRKGITWGLITSNKPSFRVMPSGATFDKGGSTIIIKHDSLFNPVLGLLNSKVFLHIVKFMNPTLNFQVREIRLLPIVKRTDENIKKIVSDNVNISKIDWDSFEISWDFKRHPLLLHIADDNQLSSCRYLNKLNKCANFVPKLDQIVNNGGLING